MHIYTGNKTSWRAIYLVAPVDEVKLYGIQLFGFFFGVIKSIKIEDKNVSR